MQIIDIKKEIEEIEIKIKKAIGKELRDLLRNKNELKELLLHMEQKEKEKLEKEKLERKDHREQCRIELSKVKSNANEKAKEKLREVFQDLEKIKLNALTESRTISATSYDLENYEFYDFNDIGIKNILEQIKGAI